MGPDPGRGERLATPIAAAVVALVAFLPFARGLLSGACFYFRDLSRHFFPLRRFAAEGLRQGELRYWNPLVHEGEPVPLLPLAYPPDLAHAILPTEWLFSLLLALHVPLAALFFFSLVRELGLGRTAAVGGASAYALGGFALSSLNLYVHAQGMAWAPLVIRGFLRTARGTWRDAAKAALALAIALTTSGIEVVAQTVLIGVVLAWPRRAFPPASRFAAVAALGMGLAAFTLFPLSGLVAASARGTGFPTEVVLSHSIHPLAFLQVLVAGFFGDPAHLAARFWGQRYFPLGFPYLVSLYLGATVLALAALGALEGRVLRRRLVWLSLLAALVCLGTWVGLGAIVEWIEPLRSLRYPSKAFFTVHFAVALLAALGLDSVRHAQDGRTLPRLSALACLLGAPLLAAPFLPRLMPGPTRWFVAGFFPPEMPWDRRLESLGFMAADAAAGGLVALLLGGLALAAARRRLTAAASTAVMAGLVSADLLRAGAGLNAMVTPSFYRLSPEMTAVARRLKEEGGCVFTCDVSQSPAYLATRGALGERQEAWSFALLRETLTPFYNLGPGVATALSLDLTMLTPLTRVASPEEAACRDLASLVPRLRDAGVTHLLSLDPVESAELAREAVVQPAAVLPLAVHVYALRHRRPRFELAGGRVRIVQEKPGLLELEAEAPAQGHLIIRQARAPGWRASVDGREVPLAVNAGGYLLLGPGRSRIRLAYWPPRLVAGAAASAASLVVLVLLCRRREPISG